MSLTGSARGATRAGITQQAKDAAAKYYGHNCLVVTLSNEQTETVTDGRIDGGLETITAGYAADWEAVVKHSIISKTYGHDYCFGCKIERPDL